MRLRGVVAGLMIGMPFAQAACGGNGLVRDWGLHRVWRIERDCAHPERPPVLLEIPWTTENKPQGSGAGSGAARDPGPAVRAGAQVVVEQHEGNAELRLVGTALHAARVGERVPVRTGLRGTILQGVVRGPGRVELEPEKGGR
jgi:hypothetical protein